MTAQPTSADSAADHNAPPILGTRDARLAGYFALGTLVVAPFDRHVADLAQRPGMQGNGLAHTSATVFRLTAQPGVVLVLPLLYAYGRATKDRAIAAAGVHATEALVVSGFVTTGLKLVVGRGRPYIEGRDPRRFVFAGGFRHEAYRSFPSGHTTVVFAAVSALTAELAEGHPDARWAVGAPLYTVAGLAGVSRIYDNKHWASDVVAGAGIGTLSGLAVARYARTRPRNRVDHWLLGVSVAPAVGGGMRLSPAILRR